MANFLNTAQVTLSLVNTGADVVPEGQAARTVPLTQNLQLSEPHAAADIASAADPNDLLRFLDTTDSARIGRFYWDTQGNLRWLLTKGNIYIHPQGGTGAGTVFLQTDLKVGDPTNPAQGSTIEHSGRINAFYDPVANKPAIWLGSAATPPSDGKLDYIYIDSPLSGSYNFLRFRKSGSDVLSVNNYGQIAQDLTFGPLAGGFVLTAGTRLTVTTNQGATASSQSFAYALNINATTPNTDSGVLGSLVGVGSASTHNGTGKVTTVYGVTATADAHGPAGTLYGTFGTAYGNNPAGATVDTLNGLFGNVAMFSAGNVTAMYGVTGWVSFINNTGLATTAATFRSRQPQLFNGSTPPTSLYGLLIEPHTIGTNSWNLYSNGSGTRNYFQGQVGIGTSNPAAGKQLHVVGDVEFDGSILQTVTLPASTTTGFYHTADSSVVSTGQGATPYGLNASPVFWYKEYNVPATDSTAPLGIYGGYLNFNHYGSANLANPTGMQVTATARDGSGGVGTMFGHYGQVNSQGTATVTAGMYGLVGYFFQSGSGAVADASGVLARQNFLGNTVRATTSSSIRVLSPRVLAGGLGATNLYGLKLDDHTVAGSNHWNLYSDGTTSRNYFAGQVGIGTSNPTAGKQLHVVGDTQMDGSWTMAKTYASAAASVQGAYSRTQLDAPTNDGASQTLYGSRHEFEAMSTNTATYSAGYGLHGLATHSSATAASALNGVRGFAVGNAGTITTISGGTFVGGVNTATTTTVVEGLSAAVSIAASIKQATVRSIRSWGNVPNNGAGATSYYGLTVERPLGSGVIDTLMGVRIEDMSGRGGVGVHYNLYSVGVNAQNVFEGDIEVTTVGRGVIMKSPNGTRWRMTVSDAGAPVFTAL